MSSKHVKENIRHTNNVFVCWLNVISSLAKCHPESCYDSEKITPWTCGTFLGTMNNHTKCKGRDKPTHLSTNKTNKELILSTTFNTNMFLHHICIKNSIVWCLGHSSQHNSFSVYDFIKILYSLINIFNSLSWIQGLGIFVCPSYLVGQKGLSSTQKPIYATPWTLSVIHLNILVKWLL